jgi:hypothetical protein
MIRHVEQQKSDQMAPEVGDRINGESPPDDRTVEHWLGREAFLHWTALRSWIEVTYRSVFVPEWLYGGKKRGWSLRYKKTKAFCTLLPGYRELKVQVVLGRAEQAKFEERRFFWRPELVKLFDEAHAYPDGKWLNIPITSTDALDELMSLVSMKRPPPEYG